MITTPKQERTLKQLGKRGYTLTVVQAPLGRGALLVSTVGQLDQQPIDLTVNTDGSYHLAWDESR